MPSLDQCPTCGRRTNDFDLGGCEAPDGQRWCIDHALSELAKLRAANPPEDHSSPWDQYTMTAGNLIDQLKKLDHDIPVIIRTEDWFLNVKGVKGLTEDGAERPHAAEINTADDYDPRQW